MLVSDEKVDPDTKLAWRLLVSMEGRLLARWESRSPMDGYFSKKINMNNCIQGFCSKLFWKS